MSRFSNDQALDIEDSLADEIKDNTKENALVNIQKKYGNFGLQYAEEIFNKWSEHNEE